MHSVLTFSELELELALTHPLEPPARAADQESMEQVPLRLVWERLVTGKWRVRHSFFSPERGYLVLTEVAPSHPPLDGRRLQILEHVLCGDAQKAVAIDLDLAPSTIALNAREALAALGVDDRPSRVHPLLMLAATASHNGQESSGRLSAIHIGGARYQVVSAPRPENMLKDDLPPAELAVMRGLLEGVPYIAIARRRGTSTRTVANQITSLFRRLGVSGRNELLQRLFQRARHEATVPPAALAPPAAHRAVSEVVRRAG